MEDPRTLKDKVDSEYAAAQLLFQMQVEDRIAARDEANARLLAKAMTKRSKRVRMNAPISERLKRHFQVKALTK